MLPRVDTALIGFEPLVKRLDRLRKRPDLSALVEPVHAQLAEGFRDAFPRLHATGRLAQSLSSQTGPWANLVKRPGELEVGTRAPYASAPNVWPNLRDLVLSHAERAADDYAVLVAKDIIEDD